MNETAENRIILDELCSGQQLAVLATNAGKAPYTSLVAFATTPDLHTFYFVTARSTRKWSYLEANRHVSLLIDNRHNTSDDFSQAAAATVLGVAAELHDKARESALAHFLDKHPGLTEFANSPDTALLQVQVASIYLVTRFQNVCEFHGKHI
ncbi:MAG TPA: pyridoxamine 5'-phosphate oxidase family protein [Desulfuromonadales bacterium]|nr:pyridoxamine 5'-phosphate oxidase family protein [Desulfuromonadales bacterium]